MHASRAHACSCTALASVHTALLYTHNLTDAHSSPRACESATASAPALSPRVAVALDNSSRPFRASDSLKGRPILP
eukprot:4813508-Pleurochrysis_carterae.AAC.2